MTETNNLFRNSRFWILVGSGLLALLLWRGITMERGELAAPQLAQWYGLIAFVLLYLTLLISPLYKRFPTLPGKPALNHARRALGVSTFGFALLHTIVAFWAELGGWISLQYLSPAFVLSLMLGLVAFVILLLLALTSLDSLATWLGPLWKRLHQLVYVAALFTLVHSVTVGSHFVDLGRAVPTVLLVATAILIILESYRVESFVAERVSLTLSRLVVPTVTIVVLGLMTWLILNGGLHSHVARAHTVHHEKEIGLVLHVDPNDDPIVGETSTVFLELTDSADRFSLASCTCVAAITQGSKELFRNDLGTSEQQTSTSFPFVFPDVGDYMLTVSGAPITDGTFDPFLVSAPIKVTRVRALTAEEPTKPSHSAHLIAAGLIAAFVVYDLVRQRLKKRDGTYKTTRTN